MEEQFVEDALVLNYLLGSLHEDIVLEEAVKVEREEGHQDAEKIDAMNVEIADILLVIVVVDDAAGNLQSFFIHFQDSFKQCVHA